MLSACNMTKQWKKEQVWPFLVVVQRIHRLMQADISCTRTARLIFLPLLEHKRVSPIYFLTYLSSIKKRPHLGDLLLHTSNYSVLWNVRSKAQCSLITMQLEYHYHKSPSYVSSIPRSLSRSLPSAMRRLRKREIEGERALGESEFGSIS